jgi:hypothetical protein
MPLLNPFDRPGRWYRANLHSHTRESDGPLTPAQTADAYRRAGYHILAITDHYRCIDVRGLSGTGLTVLRGIEYHPVCPGWDVPYHLVGLNVPAGFAFAERNPPDAARCIAEVAAAGGLTVLAHPAWCGHRWDMYAHLAYDAVEVFNYTCMNMARGDSTADWCHHLDAGRYLPALAVDDGHFAHDRFGGWVWLRMRSLTPRAVVRAVRDGCFYSSAGPAIHDFGLRGGRAEVRCSPARSITLTAQPGLGRTRRAEPGRSIRKFALPIDPAWGYIRAVVEDAAGRRAWTNPIVLDDGRRGGGPMPVSPRAVSR